MGRRRGALSGRHPVDLAAEVVRALVERSGISGTRFGRQVMCEGDGMANATVLELCP